MRKYPKVIETVGTDRVSGRITKRFTRVENEQEEAFVREMDKTSLYKAVKREAEELREQ